MFGRRIEDRLQYSGLQKKILEAKWSLGKRLEAGHSAKLWFEGTVYDYKLGRIVQHKKTPSYSWTVAFVQQMAVQASGGAVNETITEVDQTTTNIAANDADTFVCTAAATSNLKGLVVGTGVGAESVNDSKLGTIIAHGTGAGQLQYGVQNFANAVVSGNTAYFDMSRIFTANLSGAVNITEVGLESSFNTATTYCLNARDLQSYTVGLGQALTLTGRFLVDNSA